MSWAAANARRLERHALRTPAPATTDPAELARSMCGAHAQVLSAAELSLGLRIRGATCADVRRALWDDRGLVKTYGPRGTVHLLATRDLPMWTAALTAIPSQSPFPEGVRLTPEQTEQVVGAIGTALADAELTIDELSEAVVDLAGPWAGERVMPAFQDLWPRWRQAVGTAAHRGVLCFGQNRGRRVTYTSPAAGCPASRRPRRGKRSPGCSAGTSTPTDRRRRSSSPSGSAPPRPGRPASSGGTGTS